MGEHHERERIREEQERQHKAKEEEMIQKQVDAFKKVYDDVKELIVNPEAWKAVRSLRTKVRRIQIDLKRKSLERYRTEYEYVQEFIGDGKTQTRKVPKQVLVPTSDKDFMAGQCDAVALVFDFIEQAREIGKNMIPGHEADYVRSLIRKNQAAQQQR